MTPTRPSPMLVGSMALLFGAVPLPAQEQRPAADTEPPESRVYFEAFVDSPFLAPLLSQHGCSAPEAGRIRVELAGRVFDPPAQLSATDEFGRSDPVSSMSTQWALLEAGDVEGAVAGWVPEERATARALLSDPAAMERYRDQAAAIDSARVDALVWFESGAGEEPVAALIAAGNPPGFTLGMPSGLRRNEDDEFLLTIGVARDARFAIVGAAAREGAFGRIGSDDDATADDVVSYAEVCAASG